MRVAWWTVMVERKSRYYVLGVDLQTPNLSPELRATRERERKRPGTRALHTILTSGAKTHRQLENLGVEGMMSVRWCGVKTAHRILGVLFPEAQKIAADQLQLIATWLPSCRLKGAARGGSA